MLGEFPLNELKALLREASESDPDYKQFGSDIHKYRWNLPADLEEVEAFEQEIGVRLPEEYRDFLLQAGDGGAGPFYGLFSLAQVQSRLSWDLQPEREPWFQPGMEIPDEEDWEEAGEDEGEDDRDEAGQDQDQDEDERVWEECRRGCIPIGSQGDTYATYLLVTGPNRGRVVYVEDGLSWIFFPKEKGFLDWYRRWLREVAGKYHIFWFGTNLDGAEEELQRRYESAKTDEEKRLVLTSMRKFPVFTEQTKNWIRHTVKDLVHMPDARMILELLNQISSELVDDFMEQRWRAGMHEAIILEVYYIIHHLDREEEKVLEHWGNRILDGMSEAAQELWYTAFDLLSRCPWLKFRDVIGLWDVAEAKSRPELIRSLGKFPDAKEHMELFLKVLEEREDLKLLNGAVMAVPVVREERLLNSLERICREFPYNMENVEVTDWNDKEQVARWDRQQDAYTVCHNADIVLEKVREAFINPRLLGVPRPHRILLQVGARKSLGIDDARPEGGIAVHPLVALVLGEMYGGFPTRASWWDRVLSTVEKLVLKPEERYRCEGGSSHWIYMFPPTPCCMPPAPYYYDLHDWSVIGRMSRLKTLVIERLCVDDFSFLTRCRQVETLSLYNTNFCDCRLLGQMESLKKADLRLCRLEYEEVPVKAGVTVLK